ncbi:MAG: hypothetical protein R3342_09250 [Lutibacter sp.]|uniref:hypothetical protein n=1 Tax=Lutibacter sp. TaxID=1925666 RepID=UPI00299EFB2C|nr:hypothetical protein [Lutibacter sp.]MDX1829719.1 hypothetical protein [Lutibacter sp.]
MRKIIQYCFLVIAVSIQAQDFKPYKIQSGKIVYNKLRYSTRSVFKYENGVETSFSERIPYIVEQVIYYWDEFGDVAFEETYQVSKFGGKPLPKKIKIAERLWLDEHRYYFNIKENKVNDDPYRLRIKCKENFQYYQIKNSWIETQYMGAEKSGTKNILGKVTNYYKIDKFQDLYAWKGLILKNEDFATTKKGERLYPERTKIAVEIDTSFKIKEKLFNPIWLKREKLYKSLNGNKITELLDARQDLLFQADNIKGFHIQKNDILLFVTTKLNVGKLQILAIDKNNILHIKYQLYNNNGIVFDTRNAFKIKDSTLVNMDNITYKNVLETEHDFKYKNSKIIPQNNIGIYLIKASRTKHLKLKPYARN